MKQKPIGFFDSGVGGLSVLKYAIETMPEENFIYFGDSGNAPYGVKSREEVFHLSKEAINFLMEKGAKAIVVACNTATSIAVDELRKQIDIPIISMEPAIKPALEKTKGKVLLLATKVTLSSDRVNRLIDKYDNDNRLICLACARLAKKIEDAVFFESDIDEYLFEVLTPYKKENITAVVLGCTHYPFVKDRILNILGGNISVFDGIDGTVSRLKEVLLEKNIKNDSREKGNVTLYSSMKNEKTLELYNKLLYGGIL